ncbi:hypothetical protein Cantr_09243 [Candida viswanathii]|uniref:Uncharacterized protein n=1 Tax=Candida viswanathii TaxID=5486 RepID=A0A367Y9V7_9ASCO|nr:hypothetical protein Cantr_09243 [Candida viswanathii]
MDHESGNADDGGGHPSDEQQRLESEYKSRIAKLEEKIDQMQDLLDKLAIYYSKNPNENYTVTLTLTHHHHHHHKHKHHHNERNPSPVISSVLSSGSDGVLIHAPDIGGLKTTSIPGGKACAGMQAVPE